MDTLKFRNEILTLENEIYNQKYIKNIGKSKILLTAPHTMEQKLMDGNIKHPELFTKAIVLYLSRYYYVNYLIKIKDTGLDANRFNDDEFRNEIIKTIENNNIKLSIDIHGASNNRPFDVEIGTIDGITAKDSTIELLTKILNKHGIFKIAYNDPFKGGAITESIYILKKCEAIQIEINANFRDINQIDKLKSLCDALGEFILAINN